MSKILPFIIILLLFCVPVYAFEDGFDSDDNYLDGQVQEDEELIINAPENQDNDDQDNNDDQKVDNDDQKADNDDQNVDNDDQQSNNYQDDYETNENEDYENTDDSDSSDAETDQDPDADEKNGYNDENEEAGNNGSDENQQPYQITVNSELTREDIVDIERKLDILADLIYKLTITAWSLAGLYMGTKLLRGIFDG